MYGQAVLAKLLIVKQAVVVKTANCKASLGKTSSPCKAANCKTSSLVKAANYKTSLVKPLNQSTFHNIFTSPGTDATAAFAGVGHSADAVSMREAYLIGVVEGAPPEAQVPLAPKEEQPPPKEELPQDEPPPEEKTEKPAPTQ